MVRTDSVADVFLDISLESMPCNIDYVCQYVCQSVFRLWCPLFLSICRRLTFVVSLGDRVFHYLEYRWVFNLVKPLPICSRLAKMDYLADVFCDINLESMCCNIVYVCQCVCPSVLCLGCPLVLSIHGRGFFVHRDGADFISLVW